jgi:hypothetical protein
MLTKADERRSYRNESIRKSNERNKVIDKLKQEVQNIIDFYVTESMKKAICWGILYDDKYVSKANYYSSHMDLDDLETHPTFAEFCDYSNNKEFLIRNEKMIKEARAELAAKGITSSTN